MRRLLLAISIALLLLLPGTARAEEDAAIGDGVETWMADIDWHALESLLAGMPEETRALWNGISLRELTEEIALSGTGEGHGAWEKGLLHSMGKGMLRSTLESISGTLATLIGLALISALCAALSEEGKDGLHAAASLVCRCFTLTVVLTAFITLAKLASECAERLCACMEIAMPVQMTLLTALGGTASAGVLQPAMALLTGSISKCIQSVVIPLVLCAGVLAMFDNLSERVQLKELSALLHQTVKWSIGVVTTLYTAITALRGMTAAAFDGVSVRTARYAAGSMFPMVGGLVSGSFDTVLGCAALVKNAAGLTTILLCVTVAAWPILRIAVSMLLFRLTAAVLQPVAEKSLVAMCRAGADMLLGLLSACAAITAMFIVTVGIAVGVGNAAMLG